MDTFVMPEIMFAGPGAEDLRTKVWACLTELSSRYDELAEAKTSVNFAEQAQLGEDLFGLVAGAFEPQSEDTPPTSLDDYLKALHQRDMGRTHIGTGPAFKAIHQIELLLHALVLPGPGQQAQL